MTAAYPSAIQADAHESKDASAHSGGDGRLRKRRENPVERLEAVFVARAGEDVRRGDRTDGEEAGGRRRLRASDAIDVALSNPGRPVDDERVPGP